MLNIFWLRPQTAMGVGRGISRLEMDFRKLR